jgi:hypothetical protein
MRIGIIGGLERSEQDFHRIAKQHGITVEFHGGHMGGRGSGVLDRVIERADYVVISTDLNSHGAVQQARRRVRELGKESLLVRRFGIAQLHTLLDSLAPLRKSA